MAGAATLLAVGCTAPAGAGRVPAGAAALTAGTWHAAIEVPGTAALNRGGNAVVDSLSCGSTSNCSAVGTYTDGSGHLQAFVASERGGAWGKAVELPGLAALNKGGDARVHSVSCASAGNCAVGGGYTDGSGHLQAFVASERGGAWQAAVELPGMAALDKGRHAGVLSVSCASAGNCAAGGGYTDGSGHTQAFVASESNGIWYAAVEVPGIGALNKGGLAQVDSVSCGSAGNCLAGGFYFSAGGQTFVASELGGTWHAAIELPGTARLNTGGSARVLSVSCASAGNCAAGGFFTDDTRRGQAFLASERGGAWYAAIEVPGAAALSGGAEVASVSCASGGNCAAGGFYTDGHENLQAFVASETNGTLHAAIEVPGTAALNKGGATVNSMSCGSAGNCVAGGYYADRSRHAQAFVASEANGTWRAAIELPGTGTLNKGGAGVASVSCASVDSCAVGGSYTDRSGHLQAFVASQT
jgi:hypothetical protein